MMESQVDRELLEKIADLIGKPVGAFNIRKDTGCDGRQTTENIQITGKTDGQVRHRHPHQGRDQGRTVPHSRHHHQARHSGVGLQ